jgi:FAD/FMN-containing dehydrogenase
MHILDEEEFVASAVVYPSSTEEVQKIVLWANNYRIPVFPISIGRNCKSIPRHVYLWN